MPRATTAKIRSVLIDVGRLGPRCRRRLTSYDGSYPVSVREYGASLQLVLDRATTMGEPVRYVEAWNEPNNQGAQTALRAAQADELGGRALRRAATLHGDCRESRRFSGRGRLREGI